MVEWSREVRVWFDAKKEGGLMQQTRSSQNIRAKGGGSTCPAGREPVDEVIASSGVTFHLWRLYQHFWLVCLFFPLASLVREPDAWFRLALGLFALLFFATSYTWIMWPHPVRQGARVRARSRLSFLLLVILSLQVTMFSLVDGPAWLWLFIGVSAIAGMLLPMRTAGAAVVLFTLLPLFIHRPHGQRHPGVACSAARTGSPQGRRGAIALSSRSA